MAVGRKLFEEVDKPIGYKMVYENIFGVESEASWDGTIKGYNGFPDGKNIGSGNSFKGKNGVIISNWDGVFTTKEGDQLTFKGREMYKDDKFVIIRTYFTDSKKLSWVNGLVCLLEGKFNNKNNEYQSFGYEWEFTNSSKL